MTRVNGHKGNSPYRKTTKSKTLADVKKPKLKAAKKQAAANRATARNNQTILSDLLGGTKTQPDLMSIKPEVQTFGTSAQRADFNRLNDVFKKEGRALLDDYLGNVKNKSELESLRTMVEKNGTYAQKARFAEWESYFEKPTWKKYADLHGTTYTPATSGVGEADRRAAEIIAKNEKHNELQKVYEKLFNQKAEGKLAEAERLKDIGLGTAEPTSSSGMTYKKYYAERGLNYTPPTSGVAEADRRAAEIIGQNTKNNIKRQLSGGSDYKAASEALVHKQSILGKLDKWDELEAAFGADAEYVPQRTSYTDATKAAAEVQKLKDLGLGTAEPTSSTGMTWKKYFAERGMDYTPATSGVGEADRRAAEIIAENAKKKAGTLVDPPHIGTTVIGGTGTGGINVPPIGGAGTGGINVPPIGGAGTVIGETGTVAGEAAGTVASQGSNWLSKAITAGKWALGIAAAGLALYGIYKGVKWLINRNKAEDKDTQQIEQKPTPTPIPKEVKKNEIKPEAVADSIKNNQPISEDKFYIAQKGDCVWNIIKDEYIPNHKDVAETIKSELAEKFKRVPTEDEVIAEVTKRVCHQNNINYFHAQPKPFVNDTVRVDSIA